MVIENILALAGEQHSAQCRAVHCAAVCPQACPLFEAAGPVAGLAPCLQTLGAAALGWTAVPAIPYLEPWQC